MRACVCVCVCVLWVSTGSFKLTVRKTLMLTSTESVALRVIRCVLGVHWCLTLCAPVGGQIAALPPADRGVGDAGRSRPGQSASQEDGGVAALNHTLSDRRCTQVNPNKQTTLGDRFQSFLAADPELKVCLCVCLCCLCVCLCWVDGDWFAHTRYRQISAQKAFVSYIRSLCLQPNKEVVDLPVRIGDELHST